MAAMIFAEGVAADTGISSCQTLNTDGERYYLTADIIDSAVSNCITMTCKNCVLDLAGYNVDGNHAADNGIYIYYGSSTTVNITIKNGTLEDWDFSAIYLRRAFETRIENVNIIDPRDYAFHTYVADKTNITNVTVTNNYDVFYFQSTNEINLLNVSFDYPYSLGALFSYSASADCHNSMTNVTIGAKPLFYTEEHDYDIKNWDDNFSQIITCDADGLNISNITRRGDRAGQFDGGALWIAGDTDNYYIDNVNLTDVYDGIFLFYNDRGRITNVNTSMVARPSYNYGDFQTNYTYINSDKANIGYISYNGDECKLENMTQTKTDSYCLYFVVGADNNEVSNMTCLGDASSYVVYMRSNSAKTTFVTGNKIHNNFFNTSDNYLNGYSDTGMLMNFFNGSEYGNTWARSDGTLGYSETCDDLDYNGVCDYPYNTSTDTICFGSSCGNFTDYIAKSDEYDIFDIQYNFYDGKVFHDNTSFVNVNVTSLYHSTFNCSVLIDGVVKNSSSDVTNATNFYIVPDADGLADGNYQVNISCGRNTTTALNVRVDAVAPFEITRCNDSVDLENTTFYLANNIFDDMEDFNYTIITPVGESAPNPVYTCVPITAFNATLDCAGFNITGNAKGSDGAYSAGVGIQTFVNHAKVINCNISKWTYGGFHSNTNNSVWNSNDFSRSGVEDTGEEVEGVGLFGFTNRFAVISNNVANDITHSGDEKLYYSSCPVIYACDGKEYVLQNEELSPYHAYMYEGTYSARLPDLAPCPDNFKLRIVEDLDEVTHYDMIKLTEVKHAVGTEAYKDVYGNTYTVSDLKSPISCFDSVGDCLDDLIEEDGRFWNWKYSGKVDSADFEMSAVLTFRKEGDHAKMLWSPKLNAETLNPLYVVLLNYTGTANYDLFEDVIAEGKGYDGHKDAILTLYLWNGREWQHVHTGVESMSVNHAGKWIVPLDLSGIKGDTFSIKVRTFVLAGGADSIKVDFSDNEVISETDINPSAATCTNGAGLKELSADDQDYSVMKKGDWCQVEFPKPKAAAVGMGAGSETTYFTKSNGYYTPDFTKDIRANTKNFLTKPLLELTFRGFWTHDSLRSIAMGSFFTDNYMSFIKSNPAKHTQLDAVHNPEKDDNPFNLWHSRHGFIESSKFQNCFNTHVNNSCSVDNLGDMETCVYTLGCNGSIVTNNYAKDMRTCFFLFYSHNTTVSNNYCDGFNGTGVWAYSADGNHIFGNTLISKQEEFGCDMNVNTMQFLGNAGINIIATQGNANNNNIYDNLINATTPACVATFDAEVTASPNFWNQSMTAGTRIHSRTQMLGGNYYTNATGNGISDTCPDADANGFCDAPLDLENSVYGSCSSENCDFLVYSDLYACECAGYGNNQVWDLTEECYLASPCDLGAGNATFINTGVWYCNSVLTCNDFGGGDKIDVMPNCWVNITDY